MLDIIGAGFGRTGTESMKRALEILGFGPCYHMYEVMPNPERYQTWLDIYDGKITPDWDRVFDGYRSTVDWPAVRYWRELADAYPDAKILLTTRDPDSWFDSMSRTILKVVRDEEAPDTIGARLVREEFGDRTDDRDHVTGVYNAHVAEVQAAFGPDRLLTYELGSGWAPLCTFLGVDVPEVAYPKGNATEEFHARDAALSEKRVQT